MTLQATFLALLNDLKEKFNTQRNWTLEPARLPLARDLLRHLVANREALEEFFRRADPRISEQIFQPDLDYEEFCLHVVEHGADAAPAEMLSRLLLDPVGLLNIHLAVESDPAPYWQSLLANNGRELLRRKGLPTSVETLLTERPQTPNSP